MLPFDDKTDRLKLCCLLSSQVPYPLDDELISQIVLCVLKDQQGNKASQRLGIGEVPRAQQCLQLIPSLSSFTAH